MWDKHDISRRVRNDLAADEACRLLDTYFPGLPASFLGVTDPGPWLSPDEFFRPFLGRGLALSHDWELVGRGQELEKLRRVLLEDRARAVVIIGAAGTGKSRLLKAFCDNVGREFPALTVRFVAEDVPVEPRDVERLPPERPIVVVDDAHTRDDLEALFLGVARFAPDARLLLAVRPYGKEALLSTLGRAGCLSSGDESRSVLQLQDLSPIDSSALAGEVLARHGGPLDAASRIADLTRDCPLATVIASRLVANGADLRVLANLPELRVALLRAFRDELLGPARDHQASSALLELIAVVQPVTDDQRVAALAERLFGIDSHRALRLLGTLETARVLRRRAGRLRIVPDLLGDVVLAEACWVSGTSRPTGFANRVYEEADQATKINVLHNVGRLDFQLSMAPSVGRSGLLGGMWAGIVRQFRSAGILERRDLLRSLVPISWYQPERALELARIAVNEPTDHVEDGSRDGFGLTTAYRLVLDDVASLLRGAAHFRYHLPEAMALLWELAGGDPRPTNAHPDHAVRVLRELVSYRIEKPFSFVEEAVRVILGWLERDLTAESSLSPFELLDPVFEIELVDPRFTTGRELELRTGHVEPDAVRHIRRLVEDAALQALGGPSVKGAARALAVLTKAVLLPRGHFGEDRDPDLVAAWEPEVAAALDRLREAVEEHAVDPVLLDAIIDLVSGKADGEGRYREAARRLRQAIRPSADLRLSQAMSHWYPPGWFAGHRDYAEADPHWQGFLKKVADELCGEPSPDGVAVKLAGRLRALFAARGGEVTVARSFCDQVFRLRPDVSRVVVEDRLRHPDSAFAPVWPLAYAWLRATHDGEALELALDAVRRNDPSLIEGLLEALGRDEPDMAVVTLAEAKLLDQLRSHPSPEVRAGVPAPLGRLARSHAARALDGLLAIPVDGSGLVAQAVCRQLDCQGLMPASGLDDTHRKRLLRNLESCPALDLHGVEAVIVALSDRAPLDVLRFLQTRIERSRARGLGDPFLPIPYSWGVGHSPLKVRASEGYDRCVREIVAWTAADIENVHHHFWAPHLWSAVVVRTDASVLSQLREWIGSTDPRDVMAVSTLLSDGPPNLVLAEVDFVVDLLESASRHGPECLSRVRKDLWQCAASGVRGHRPGEAAPEDLRRRDAASAAACRLPPGSVGHLFYRDLARAAEEDIRWTALMDQELEEEADEASRSTVDRWTGLE
ncbi:MAG: ATP-binding protein [Actinomycetota bacterium]|nr:ATP-binding protein [Actinomycetota bacterium]